MARIAIVAACVCASLTALYSPALAQKREKLTIYVDSAHSTKEFSDPSKDRMDSVRDLVGHLKRSDFLRPVPNESDAAMLLEVTERATAERLQPVFGRQTHSFVRVRLTVGDFTTDFEGSSSFNGQATSWARAAGSIAAQVNRWVETNWDKLQTLKPAVAASSPTK